MSRPSPKIAVIGSANIDFIMKMARLPRVGETITDAVFLQTYGGKGANQALSAARAGGDTWFVSCLGEESLADRMIAGFREDGIHTDFVFREPGCPSGTALVMIGVNGDNYLSVAPGANYSLSPSHIDSASQVLRDSDVVLVQYEVPLETLLHAMRKAVASRVPVLLNFAPARPQGRELLELADVLVVNESEAELLTGLRVSGGGIAEAADQLAGMGPHTVVITLGPAGAWVSSKALRGLVPPFAVDVVDSTGAGDAFCGALAVGLAEGRQLREALRFASAAAALSVTRMGAQPSMPFRADIEAFMAARTPAAASSAGQGLLPGDD